MADHADTRRLYLDLLKRSLLGTTLAPSTIYSPIEDASALGKVSSLLAKRGGPVLARGETRDPAADPEGRLFVTQLFPGIMSMVGSKRLDNVEACVTDVVENDVPGDLIETGVWRGGACILMRGVLKALGVTDRTVYVADSFEGLPPPDAEKYPADAFLNFHLHPELAVGLEDVRANFERFGLLDDQVRFVQGWFRDTLPELRDHQWSVIRLDGDLYESTMDAIDNLYPGLQPGGWVIVDDYYDIDACAQAILDYRDREGIREPMVKVDWTGMCWQKA